MTEPSSIRPDMATSVENLLQLGENVLVSWVADNLKAQLAALRKRRANLERVAAPELSEQRVQGLAAIDASAAGPFPSKIEKSSVQLAAAKPRATRPMVSAAILPIGRERSALTASHRWR